MLWVVSALPCCALAVPHPPRPRHWSRSYRVHPQSRQLSSVLRNLLPSAVCERACCCHHCCYL